MKKRHYIGITDDVEQRLKTHNAGGVRSTKPYRPWRIGYIENYQTRTEARKREIFLKRTARARNDIFASIDHEAPSSNG